MLLQEVQQLENKFESWSQITKPELSSRSAPLKPLASARDVTKDLPPEVAAFDVSGRLCIYFIQVLPSTLWPPIQAEMTNCQEI